MTMEVEGEKENDDGNNSWRERESGREEGRVREGREEKGGKGGRGQWKKLNFSALLSCLKTRVP